MRKIVYISLISFVLFFSLNSAIYKAAGNRGIPMLNITSMALIVVSILLGPILFRSDRLKRIREARMSSLIAVFFVALMGGCLAFWFLAEGVSRAGVSRGGIFLAMIPVSTAIIDHLFGGTITKDDIIYGGMIVAGGILLSTSGLDKPLNLGDVLLVGAVLSFSISNVSARFAMRDISPLSVTACRAIGGALGLLAFGGKPFVSGWWGLLSGMFSVVFLICFYIVIRHQGPTRAAFANIVSGVLATVWGMLLFHETMTTLQLTGSAIVILGSTMWVRSQEREVSPTET